MKQHARPMSYSRIAVRARPGNPTQGWLAIGPHRIPVALGRGGIKANKREGDGGTPRGTFRPLRLWWRPDRGICPRSLLEIRRIGPKDAWCEDPKDRNYNRHLSRAPGEPGDRMQREDHLYDLIVEIDHNTRPRVAGLGSAVFLHVSRPGLRPTAGCVAMPVDRLRFLIGKLGPRTKIVIQ